MVPDNEYSLVVGPATVIRSRTIMYNSHRGPCKEPTQNEVPTVHPMADRPDVADTCVRRDSIDYWEFLQRKSCVRDGPSNWCPKLFFLFPECSTLHIACNLCWERWSLTSRVWLVLTQTQSEREILLLRANSRLAVALRRMTTRNWEWMRPNTSKLHCCHAVSFVPNGVQNPKVIHRYNTL